MNYEVILGACAILDISQLGESLKATKVLTDNFDDHIASSVSKKRAGTVSQRSVSQVSHHPLKRAQIQVSRLVTKTTELFDHVHQVQY